MNKKFLHPTAHLLLKKDRGDKVRLYLNFPKDKRKKLPQVQKCFKDLKINELSNKEPTGCKAGKREK